MFFFQLLATTRAASLDQRRRFSCGFYTMRPCLVLHFSVADHLQRQNEGFDDPCVNQHTLNLHEEIPCSFPLLATTGATSLDQGR